MYCSSHTSEKMTKATIFFHYESCLLKCTQNKTTCMAHSPIRDHTKNGGYRCRYINSNQNRARVVTHSACTLAAWYNTSGQREPVYCHHHKTEHMTKAAIFCETFRCLLKRLPNRRKCEHHCTINSPPIGSPNSGTSNMDSNLENADSRGPLITEGLSEPTQRGLSEPMTINDEGEQPRPLKATGHREDDHVT